MIPYLVPFIYLAVCALTGYFGRATRIGFWGTFLLAIAVTPFVVLAGLVLLSVPSRRNPS
jgi:hypothetical protein